LQAAATVMTTACRNQVGCRPRWSTHTSLHHEALNVAVKFCLIVVAARAQGQEVFASPRRLRASSNPTRCSARRQLLHTTA
jgi:hypothetical protein